MRPARATTAAARNGDDLVLPRARRHGRARRRRRGAGRPGRRRHRARHRAGRPRRPGQRRAGLDQAQGARLRAQGRARRRAHDHPRAQGRRRHRPRSASRAPASPASSPRCRGPGPRSPTTRSRRWCPNLGVVIGRLDDLHRRRRPRSDRGRQRGSRPRPRLPAPRRALRRAGARHRLRHGRARPRPADRPRRHRGRARAYGEATGIDLSTVPAWSRSTRPTSPTPRRSPSFVRDELEARGLDVFDVSAASHAGLRELSFAMAEIVASPPRRRAASPRSPASCCARRPRPVSVASSRSRQVDGQWVVRGEKPKRWVRQTDFSNDEAVGFLADRLNRLGVEDELLKLGAEAGDDVVIGDEDDAVVFDFDPQITGRRRGARSSRRGPAHRPERPPHQRAAPRGARPRDVPSRPSAARPAPRAASPTGAFPEDAEDLRERGCGDGEGEATSAMSRSSSRSARRR